MSRKQRVCGFYDAFESGTASPDGATTTPYTPAPLLRPLALKMLREQVTNQSS